MKYVKIDSVLDVEQFNYVDGDIESPGTISLAESLGLSRNLPHSKLWELHTRYGWKIVYSGDYVVTRPNGEKEAIVREEFEEDYAPLSTFA